jgi:hypothetical protein
VADLTKPPQMAASSFLSPPGPKTRNWINGPQIFTENLKQFDRNDSLAAENSH